MRLHAAAQAGEGEEIQERARHGVRALRAHPGEQRPRSLVLHQVVEHLRPRLAALALHVHRRLNARLYRVQGVERHRAGEPAEGARQRLHEHLFGIGQRAELRHVEREASSGPVGLARH